jgi:alpha/beta superfamily hydrolase
MLIIHGTADEAVSWEEALKLKKWNAHAHLHLVEGANHVFGASHPWNSEEPPHTLKGVAEKTIRFFENVILPKLP